MVITSSNVVKPQLRNYASNGDLDCRIKAHLRAIVDLPEQFLNPRTHLKDAESRYASNGLSFSSIALTAVNFAKMLIFGDIFLEV